MHTLWFRLRRLHPAVVLGVLDLIGLGPASYLAGVELANGVPACGPLRGCETVATSVYARIGGPHGIPVAVLGVLLSLALLGLAVAWWRTGDERPLVAHYGFALIGVIFETYLTYLELFVIHAVCVWCVSYFISLLACLLVSLLVWRRRDRYRARVNTGDASS